jgi:hypothetical protein
MSTLFKKLVYLIQVLEAESLQVHCPHDQPLVKLPLCCIII